jgi:hypothetical protein
MLFSPGRAGRCARRSGPAQLRMDIHRPQTRICFLTASRRWSWLPVNSTQPDAGVSCPGMSAGPDKIEQKIKKDHLAEREVVHGRGKAASPQWHQDRPLTLAPYPAAGPPSAIPIAALPARQHDPSRASTQLQQRPRYPGPPSPPRPSGHQPRSPGPQARPDPPDTSPRPPAPHPGRR